MLVEVVAVNGPGEGVLEGPPVEQPHTLLLRRPPRQVARRRPRRAHLSPRLLTSDLLLLCDGTLKYYRVGNGESEKLLLRPGPLGLLKPSPVQHNSNK